MQQGGNHASIALVQPAATQRLTATQAGEPRMQLATVAAEHPENVIDCRGGLDTPRPNGELPRHRLHLRPPWIIGRQGIQPVLANP